MRPPSGGGGAEDREEDGFSLVLADIQAREARFKAPRAGLTRSCSVLRPRQPRPKQRLHSRDLVTN